MQNAIYQHTCMYMYMYVYHNAYIHAIIVFHLCNKHVRTYCTQLQISDLVTTTAVQTVEQALLATNGVTSVTITSSGEAHIEYDNTLLGPRDILRIAQVRVVVIIRVFVAR